LGFSAKVDFFDKCLENHVGVMIKKLPGISELKIYKHSFYLRTAGMAKVHFGFLAASINTKNQNSRYSFAALPIF